MYNQTRVPPVILLGPKDIILLAPFNPFRLVFNILAGPFKDNVDPLNMLCGPGPAGDITGLSSSIVDFVFMS